VAELCEEGAARDPGVLGGLFRRQLFGVGESAQEEETEVPTDRPNMIFVLTDDLDYASAQQMPELSSLLAKEGATFENAFVSHPICCPSRSTILTGLYDHNHGVKSNSPPDGGFQKFRDEGHEENTIAARLQEEGYRTTLFGKYLNGSTEAGGVGLQGTSRSGYPSVFRTTPSRSARFGTR
jgi:arylsulfatase A-like enzyme